ncbi:MAG: MaoC family dehydratase N-terminal domain-containing protein [Betaproteobacteria bacterium]|nr:MaoC family dehydratase N-terminal domain-containing protein [Betaproteobacteria bacterium]
MTAIDIDHLRRWVGREQRDADIAALRHARLMAATVDRPGPPLAAGDALPPLWHWIYFLDARPPGELGRDGHPARGGFLPPVPLPNRMWAGGTVDFDAPIPLGAAIEKRSTVAAVEHKRGRSGELVFVTVLHEVHAAGRRALRETHDIVYKDAAPSAPPPPVQATAVGAIGDAAPAMERAWTPDATQLFRYSALTFNGHRIHYDADYCRQVEGYADLVVHGPLIATQLAALAEQALGAPLARFRYRALRPVLRGATLMLRAARAADRGAEAEPGVELRAVLPDGAVAIQAQASGGG